METSNIENLDKLINLLYKKEISNDQLIKFITVLQVQIKSLINSKFKKAFNSKEIVKLQQTIKTLKFNENEKVRFIELEYEDKTGSTVKDEIENFYAKVFKKINKTSKSQRFLSKLQGKPSAEKEMYFAVQALVK